MCALRVQKWRVGHHDICHRCEVTEIQAEELADVIHTVQRWAWEDHAALMEASGQVYMGLRNPHEGPWPGDAPFGTGVFPYGKDYPAPDWSANDDAVR